jgi:hypothetical protein
LRWNVSRKPTLAVVGAPRRAAQKRCCSLTDFTVAQLVELVRSGLATATPQRVKVGREVLQVATLRITDAGRDALAGYCLKNGSGH